MWWWSTIFSLETTPYSTKGRWRSWIEYVGDGGEATNITTFELILKRLELAHPWLEDTSVIYYLPDFFNFAAISQNF